MAARSDFALSCSSRTALDCNEKGVSKSVFWSAEMRGFELGLSGLEKWVHGEMIDTLNPNP